MYKHTLLVHKYRIVVVVPSPSSLSLPFSCSNNIVSMQIEDSLYSPILLNEREFGGWMDGSKYIIGPKCTQFNIPLKLLFLFPSCLVPRFFSFQFQLPVSFWSNKGNFLPVVSLETLDWKLAVDVWRNSSKEFNLSTFIKCPGGFLIISAFLLSLHCFWITLSSSPAAPGNPIKIQAITAFYLILIRRTCLAWNTWRYRETSACICAETEVRKGRRRMVARQTK